MKVAFVRHPEMSGRVDAQVKKSTEALRQAGFQGEVAVYCSPAARTQVVADMISRENGYPKPLVSKVIGLDDGEKSGRVFRTNCEKNGIATTLGHTSGGMLVLVTHEPVIKAATGRKYVDYSEVVVCDIA